MAMVSPNSLHMIVGVPCACEEETTQDEFNSRLSTQTNTLIKCHPLTNFDYIAQNVLK